MRWNCPHCEELVTAGIDFANTKKAYVRCAKCKGMAIVHRSAVLADYVKARRMEEEAQLEAELRLAQAANANSRANAMEAQIRGLNQLLSAERANAERLAAAPPAPMAMMNADGSIEPSRAIPPPFRPEPAISAASAAAPTPSFVYSTPPAFLLKPNAIETIERAFASDDESVAPTILPASTKAPTGAGVRATLALWIAIACAVASGIYLYQEGKRAFAPSASVSAKAE